MKKALLFGLVTIFLVEPTFAAPKNIQVKKIEIVTSANNAEGLILSGKNIITFANTPSPNANAVVTAIDAAGGSQWVRTIDSGSDEVVTAASVDSLGNIWLAGSSAPIVAAETATALSNVENPDGVIQEPVATIRPDLTQLTVWKLSPLGELLATYISSQTATGLVNAVSVNASGVSLVGQLNGRPFLLSASLLGEFGKIIYLGTEKTQVNALLRMPDGSINLFGSSTEKLAGKKLVGSQDGFLMKVGKSGAITSVVRSSAPKATRSWLAADTNLTLTGFVKSGKIMESAFTKFNTTFTPTWTIRVPSLGKSVVAVAPNTTYGAINSQSAIKGLNGWKPTTPSLLILAFDAKGVISGGYGSSDLVAPISLAYSREIGVIGLAMASDKSVSIFRLSTR